jgi:tRNA C32,U32 (ribose-2'-O)-methylase TrmJ
MHRKKRALRLSAFRLIEPRMSLRERTRVGAMRAARIMPIDIISPSLGPAKLSSRRSAERASGAQQVLDAVSASRTLLLSLRRCPHNQPPSAAITRPAGRREQIHDRGNTDMSLRQAVSLSS